MSISGSAKNPATATAARCCGRLASITEAAGFQAWMREMLSPAQVDAFQRDKEFDGSHAFPFVRVRINLLESLRGPPWCSA